MPTLAGPEHDARHLDAARDGLLVVSAVLIYVSDYVHWVTPYAAAGVVMAVGAAAAARIVRWYGRASLLGDDAQRGPVA